MLFRSSRLRNGIFLSLLAFLDRRTSGLPTDHCLEFNPLFRPNTTTILLHPYFWDAGKRLSFLQDASDQFESMRREPPDPNLVELERGAVKIVGVDWSARLDRSFVENLDKYRKYDMKSVQDLLRALRSKVRV